MSKLTPEETLQALSESWLDGEIERLTKMTEEDLDKDLEGNGFDVADLETRAHAWREKHLGVPAATTSSGVKEKP